MREVYMMTVLSVKTARDKFPSPINDPDRTDFKVGDMVLLKTIPQQQPLNLNTNLAIEFANDFPTKRLTYRITQEMLGMYSFNIYYYHI